MVKSSTKKNLVEEKPQDQDAIQQDDSAAGVKDETVETKETQEPPEEVKDKVGPERDPEMEISEHVTYKEATASITAEELGLNNDPPDDILEVMKVTSKKLFEPLRKFWGCRIGISSFYRSPELNAVLEKDKVLKASKNSQHMTGEAMDIDAKIYGLINNRQVFEYLRDNCIFDQLIWEEGDDDAPEWVHVSFRAGNNRMQVERKHRVGSRIYYQDITPGQSL